MPIGPATLRKAERQNKQLVIGKLFEGEGKSISAFPLRVVYMLTERNEEAPASILVSVPKRHFKRAVKRNRTKRQIREAYRLNKLPLLQALTDKPYGLVIAFIWLDKQLHDTEEISLKVNTLLERIIHKLPVE